MPEDPVDVPSLLKIEIFEPNWSSPKGSTLHIVASPGILHRQEDHPRLVRDAEWQKLGLRGLLWNKGSESFTADMHLVELEYLDCGDVGRSDLEKMVRRIRKVMASLEKANAEHGPTRSFGQRIIRFAHACGVRRYMIRRWKGLYPYGEPVECREWQTTDDPAVMLAIVEMDMQKWWADRAQVRGEKVAAA